MPDKKITELTALIRASVDVDDVLPIVDNDADETKKIKPFDLVNLNDFATVDDLLADTRTSLGETGDSIYAGGYRYTIAASGATDHNLTTAGGVKLYVLPGFGRVITPYMFNAIGDADGAGGGTDDTAAFTAMWQMARDSWFTDAQPLCMDVSGTFFVEAPTDELSNVATYIMDFAGEFRAAGGSFIEFAGASTAHFIQTGTYDTRFDKRNIEGVRIRRSGGNRKGWLIAENFQNRQRINRITCENTVADFTFANVQEMFSKGFKSDISTGRSFHFTASGYERANGSNGSYTSNTGSSANNNNHIEIHAQAFATDGLLHEAGTNNTFSGMLQVGSYTGYMADITGGVHLQNLYFEDASAKHDEIIFRSGNLLMTNVNGTTSGSKARFDGGKVTIQGGAWDGRYGAFNDAQVVADYPPGNGNISGSKVIAYLNRERAQSAISDTRDGEGVPANRRRFYSGSIVGVGTKQLTNFGNNSTNNRSKGFVAQGFIYESGGTDVCQFTWHASANGALGSPASSVTEHTGTLAACGAALNAYTVGSSPNWLLSGELENTTANTLHYAIEITDFEV